MWIRHFYCSLLIAVLVSACAHHRVALDESAEGKEGSVERRQERTQPDPPALPSGPVAPPSVDPFDGAWVSLEGDGGEPGEAIAIERHGRTNYLLKIGDQAIPATRQGDRLLVRTPAKDYLIVYDSEEDTLTMCEVRQILRRASAQQHEEPVPPQGTD